MEPVTLTAIGTVGTLASVLIQLWREFRPVRATAVSEAALRRLEIARREHTAEIRALRDTVLTVRPKSLGCEEKGRENRLEEEARYLNAMGFDVIFEEVDHGYGLAIPLSAESALVLWISEHYPSSAPTVVIWEPPVIDSIEFSEGSWSEDRYLAEIVAAVYPTLTS